ncbi:MAG: hypothetical protein D6744_17825 [Planctomycetota bacterium]|nr:MAG: hypothetical protein D6744_17825 [Planctomycetota bacterium]
MFYRLSNSWRLFGATLDVLRKDKELMLFPLLSGLAAILLVASFAGGMWGFGLIDQLRTSYEANNGELTPREFAPVVVLGLLFYFVNFFIVIYFNAALVGAARIRLRGGDPTVADGFAAANRCLPAILGYSLIAATVGLILNALQNRARDNFLGRIVVGLIGMAWTLITYLVVPVLVIERLGPLAAIRRSASMLRETWGEQIIANFGFGMIGFAFSLVGFAIAGGGVFLATQAGFGIAFAVAAVALAVLYWIVLSLVLSSLRGIYTAALYCYAANDEVRGFPVELVSEAFSPRIGPR